MGNKFYGEIVLGVVVKSKMEFEDFKSMFEENGLRGSMVLKTVDDAKTDAEVLDVYSTDWSEFDE